MKSNFIVFIEFCRGTKSRDELKSFEKYCKQNPTTSFHFLRVEGRKFFFWYKSEIDAFDFLKEAKAAIEAGGLATKYIY
jgi:hypothetical protein